MSVHPSLSVAYAGDTLPAPARRLQSCVPRLPCDSGRQEADGEWNVLTGVPELLTEVWVGTGASQQA